MSHLQSFKIGRITRRSKYGHFTLSGVFLDKVIPSIDFTEQVVVQCDIVVVEILL